MTTPADHLIQTPRGALFSRRWTPGAGEARGATIVLFHDSLGSVALWRDFPRRLADAAGRAVVAYDRLGFGRSDPSLDRLDFDFMADEARASLPALREALGFERFVAFGHSVGGAMAVACAALHPEACEAVITESAQAFVEDRTLAGIRDAQVQFSDPAQVARLARYHGDKARWVLDAWIETWLSPGFADWTLDPLLARVAAPLLAIHGEHDEFGSNAHPERIAGKAGAGGRLALLPDCGHVPHREHPEKVLAVVTDFLLSAARRG